MSPLWGLFCRLYCSPNDPHCIGRWWCNSATTTEATTKENPMNTSTLVRSTNAAWLRRGTAIVGTLLVGGAIAVSVAIQAFGAIPVSSPDMHLSAGRERFTALKQAQVDARDAIFAVSPAYDAGRERFADLKQRQAELREQGQ